MNLTEYNPIQLGPNTPNNPMKREGEKCETGFN